MRFTPFAFMLYLIDFAHLSREKPVTTFSRCALASIAEAFIRELPRFEGDVEHFYRDTRGVVTIGIGIAVESLEEALSLPLMDRRTGQRATPQAIREEYERISRLDRGGYAPNYRDATNLYLEEEDRTRLATEYVGEIAVSDTIQRFPDFGSFPRELQVAILDMIYNIGITKFNDQKWPNFFRAIRNRDWVAAANDSSRIDVGTERNEHIYNLLMQATRDAGLLE